MKEEPNTIYFTDDPDDGLYIPPSGNDTVTQERISETEAILICFLGCLGLLSVIAIIFCSIYFI